MAPTIRNGWPPGWARRSVAQRPTEGYGGYERMVSRHLGKALREDQRARWVQLLCRSADDAGLPADPEWRAAFVAYLEWGSRIALENSQPERHPPPHMPVPRWWWVCDATPARAPSALAAEAYTRSALELPGADEPSPLRAAREAALPRDRSPLDALRLRPLVARGRQRARRGDPRTPAGGTMPCDGAWPAERVEVFERWVEAGSPG